jgi:hypothetical protein
VFLAFGFNMVDCGGILGGRLGSNNASVPKAKKKVDDFRDPSDTRPLKRTFTAPA